MVRVILGDFTAAARTDCVLTCLLTYAHYEAGFVLFVFTAATRTDCGCSHSYTAATRTDCDCSHSMYGLIFRILYVFINDPCLICTVPFCLLTFVIRNGPSHSIVPNLFSISFGPLSRNRTLLLI